MQKADGRGEIVALGMAKPALHNPRILEPAGRSRPFSGRSLVLAEGGPMPPKPQFPAAMRLLTTSLSVWPGARHRDRDEIATDLSHQRPLGEPERLASCFGPTRMMVLPFNEYRRGDHVRI